MHLSSLVSGDFHVVHPDTPVNSIEDILVQKNFVVVQDERKMFYGVLTPSDIIARPHKIVIDCIGTVERIDANEDVESAYYKMIKVNQHVLPVFRDEDFLGIIKMQNIADAISCEKESTVSKIEEMQKQLEEERKRSQVAESIKNAFIRNITHELRTPLNGLVGFTDLLSSSKFNDYQKKEFYHFVSESSQRFLSTVDEIIELSRIQSGDMKVKRDCECSAASIIDELQEYYNTEKYALERSAILIRTNKEEPDAKFVSDISQVRQVLSYIIHNALKFTHEGFIEIGFRTETGAVVFYVKDTGEGIPADKQDKVFIAFEKLEDERQSLLPGIGLGLTIAKHLANSLDGDIWFESVEGDGTVFYLTIPA
ncbi:MAG TPA: ATP-binding protein [Bacteroidales bacterium]|nr:ATP-binding protein [Bacteroidales bacterium]